MRAVILALALVGLVGCGGKPQSKTEQPTQQQQPTPSKVMTRAEFDEVAKTLKTGADFIAKFGKPVRTNPFGGSDPLLCLVFDKITIDPISGKTDRSVLVYVKGSTADGEYVRHSFSPGL